MLDTLLISPFQILAIEFKNIAVKALDLRLIGVCYS